MRKYLFVLLSACLIPFLNAQDFPKPMVPKRIVNDYTGLLNQQEQMSLENKLVEFNRETSTQVAIVTYDDLQGFDIADYGDRLAQNWGIGQKDSSNGILILVSPAAHKMTIRVGYGLEGAVPDAIAKRIIEKVLSPHFKNGQYFAGLDSATNVIMSLTRGEYSAEEFKKETDGNSGSGFIIVLLIMLFFFFISGSRRQKMYSPRHSIPWWLLLGTGASRGGSDWGSFSSGRGSFGGGSGGGFGGFGGGSFGGGGASGGW